MSIGPKGAAMRRLSVLMVALLAVLGAAVAAAGVVVPGVAAAAASCATPWTSGVDTAATLNPSPLVAVQTRSHACYDRVVFRIAGSVSAGWDVRYVDVVRTDGSGAALAVPGGARLEVRLHHPAYHEGGRRRSPRRSAAGGPTWPGTPRCGRWSLAGRSRATRCSGSARGPGRRSASSRWPARVATRGSCWTSRIGGDCVTAAGLPPLADSGPPSGATGLRGRGRAGRPRPAAHRAVCRDRAGAIR